MITKRARLTLMTVLASLALPSFADSLSEDEALTQRFENYFEQVVAGEQITGAAFVVARPEGIVRLVTAGHTDTTRQYPIDENTVFRVASVSKTFAAGLAGMLVGEGRFHWDDPVVRYVPDFRINGDASRVRVGHLLGQSTGLVPHAYDNLIEDGLSLERITDQYRKLSYICPPGQCYSYQNSIFSLIEPVIEHTTEHSYAELMSARIFIPLGMETASIGFEPFVETENRALPHVKRSGRWRTVTVKPNYYRVAPAAGVNASILDMGKWLTANLGGNPSVIAPELIDELTQPRVKTARDRQRRYWRDLLSDAHYGLGWRLYRVGDEEIIYHSGWVSGYRADLAWSAEHDIGIAVLMNVEGNAISDLTTTFWRMAFDSLPASSTVAASP